MKVELQTAICRDSILVASRASQTIFIQVTRPPLLSLGEFTRNLALLIRSCKAGKVRLYRKGADYFIDNFQEYQEEYARVSGLFDQLSEIALDIEREGLEAPTINNPHLRKAYPITAEYERGFWRSTICSRMQELFCRVEALSKSDLKNYTMLRL